MSKLDIPDDAIDNGKEDSRRRPGGSDIMNLVEAAEYLGCHRTTLRGLINNQGFPAFRLLGGLRFRRGDIDRWIAKQTVVRTNPEPR